jgi:hypothetical protein
MKPAWDKLMKLYEGNPSAGVFDVDCTAAGKPLCDSNGVRGFPTIKYGDPNNLEKYEGGRDFSSLKKFAEENLKPVCGPGNMDLCDEAQAAELKKFMDMSDAELKQLVKDGDKKKKDAEKTFKDEVSKLQKKYEGLMEAKDAAIEEVDNSGYKTAKGVQAFKKSAAKDEL